MSYSIQIIEDTFTPCLRQLQAALQNKVVGKMQETGNKMVGYARSIVPIRTGFLRDSIYAQMIETMALEFGAKAPYAIFVEMGTYRMAARPFIRPAAETYTPEFLSAITSTIMEAIT